MPRGRYVLVVLGLLITFVLLAIGSWQNEGSFNAVIQSMLISGTGSTLQNAIPASGLTGDPRLLKPVRLLDAACPAAWLRKAHPQSLHAPPPKDADSTAFDHAGMGKATSALRSKSKAESSDNIDDLVGKIMNDQAENTNETE